MTQIVIYGCGEQGKVAADALLDTGATILGFVDDQVVKAPYGLSFLGTWEQCKIKFRDCSWHVAIGNNQVRSKVSAVVEAYLKKPLMNIFHQKSSVSPRADLSAGGVFVAACAVVGPDAKIGKGCLINHSASVDHDNLIASCVHLAPGAHLAGRVEIGENTLMGIGSIVLPGVKIGKNVIVGAGAVVTRDVSDGLTVVGRPAKSR